MIVYSKCAGSFDQRLNKENYGQVLCEVDPTEETDKLH